MKLKRLLIVTFFITLLLGSASLTLAQSDTNGVIWNSTFYNNSFLGEPASVSRQDTSLAFDWEGGSPDARIDNDYFSARFTTTFLFTDDFYRFQVVADDGVRIILDNSVTILDTFNDPRPSQTLIADADIASGVHTVQVDYREITGQASLYVGWTPVTNPSSPITVPTVSTRVTSVTTNPISPTSDWVANYYSNSNLAGTPSAIITETTPSHNWGTGSPFPSMPADNFSAQWTGTLYLDGIYEISVRADDGVRVYVDGVLYIDEWHLSTGDTYRARFSAPAGNHTIMIEYYELTELAYLEYDLTAVSTGSASVVQPPITNINSSLEWLVQYYDNAGLSGTPVLTQSEDRVSRTWGYGAPTSTMPADNFSVRFISNPQLDAGEYVLNVRADDGVRVYIDGVLYIDEWHISDGTELYSTTVNLRSGLHNITIEYYENTRVASIEYALEPVSVISNPILNPDNLNDPATATVTASQLNVRSEPNVFAPILTKVSRGETYEILSQNSAGTWLQLNVNGLIGWVNERYTDEFNYTNVAVVDETFVDTPNLPGYNLSTTANLNMRRGPGLEYDVIRIIPEETVVSILGRTIDADWWQVSYRGSIGWVTESFVRLAANVTTDNVGIVTP